MKILVLGGTRFLGRHFVDAALANGHAISVFTRGRTPVPWGARVDARVGDRDPFHDAGLVALTSGEWDAVLDTSGYVPRVVAASADLLKGRVGRYLFVSSLSVYAKSDRPGLDEHAEVARLEDPGTEDVLTYYGALKAACETEVRARFGLHTTIVRPGLIVGPHDSTDRFGYWVARFRQPALLGNRGSEAIVPSPPERPIQLIDARDLAAWMLALLEGDREGTFNACSGNGYWSMRDLVDALRSGGSPVGPTPVWIDDATLLARGIAPWVGLPLWIPANDPDSGGFLSFDCGRAARAGLAPRPLTSTIADTAAWLAARANAGAWKNVLSAEREREIVEAFRQSTGA
ncbi:MAG TPA: NAD-dependent epimerase/dehydratase family protein [Casimicrobiaceae bacterium]